MRRTVTFLALLLVAALLASPSTGTAAAEEPQDCFWTSVFDEENGNLFYQIGRASSSN